VKPLLADPNKMEENQPPNILGSQWKHTFSKRALKKNNVMNLKERKSNSLLLQQQSHARSCPICMIQGCSTELNFEITGIWLKPKKIHHCKLCNLYFLNEKPNPYELKNYYQETYYFKSIFLDLIKSRFRLARSISQYNFFKENISQNINNVIEIGSGDGLLLSLFKHDNAQVFGIEYSKKYKKYARKKYSISLSDDDFFNIHGKYDLIIMSHVFEHFLDFKKVYEKAHQLLISGGLFYIEIPNSPKQSETSISELSSYLNSTHIHNFDKDNFIKSVPANFEIITIQRFDYDIKTFFNKNITLLISKSLLNSKLSKEALLDTIINLLRVLIAPKKFYKKIDLQKKWQGYGDNIRVILKKNDHP
jgi:SAM-dependent methyltransferase